MCGIAGMLTRPPGDVPDGHLRRMQEVLRHRGPDDSGCLRWDAKSLTPGDGSVSRPTPVALVHTRLSIIDLTEGGHQPMSTADGRYHLVYNGEIYNYLELREQLTALGHSFQTASDTEVLLKAFAEWGTGSLTRLVGMFAFGVLDTHERELVVARDPFGIKPLYYTAGGEGFAFASEIKALLVLPSLRRRAHPQALHDYLVQGHTEHDQQTLFADVLRVLPGEVLRVPIDNPAGVRSHRYWRVPRVRSTDISFDEAASHLRDLFVDSVELHLRSDVPLGAALSGGIDSSSIVAVIRHVLGSGADIQTFGYVADDPRLSEERWGRLAADHASAKYHDVHADGRDLVNDLDHLIAVQDEPFRSTSIYAQFRVFRRAREAGVKVVLDGQGADELLAGYRPHIAARCASLFSRGRLGAGLRLAASAARHPGGAPVNVTTKQAILGLAPNRLTQLAIARSTGGRFPTWLDETWIQRNEVSSLPMWDGARTLGALLATNFERRLPALLRYEDRNSMAHSIESRVPFLTPAIVSFLFSLPEQYLISNEGTTKAVFRAAMRGLVPDGILDRQDKIGFQTPERRWLEHSQEWVEHVLSSDAAQAIPFMATETLTSHWRGILSGRRDLSPQMWRWINLIRWADLNSVEYPE